jgi:RNA polymerase sigma factor (sigma-70 family)
LSKLKEQDRSAPLNKASIRNGLRLFYFKQPVNLLPQKTFCIQKKITSKKLFQLIKVISIYIRLYNYMDEIIALQMMQKHQSILDAFQNYGKRLFGFIRSRVKNDEDAEDILQDVWYALCLTIDTKPIEQLSTWLYRVSKNKIIDKMRKQTSLSLEDFVYEDEEGEFLFSENMLADNVNPEKELEAAYFRDSFLEALSELPEKQRQVFVWNELEGFTLREIAGKTGENIKTIISRKRYAVAQLRERLKDLNNN